MQKLRNQLQFISWIIDWCINTDNMYYDLIIDFIS